jgi:hypothetical protein
MRKVWRKGWRKDAKKDEKRDAKRGVKKNAPVWWKNSGGRVFRRRLSRGW